MESTTDSKPNPNFLINEIGVGKPKPGDKILRSRATSNSSKSSLHLKDSSSRNATLVNSRQGQTHQTSVLLNTTLNKIKNEKEELAEEIVR